MQDGQQHDGSVFKQNIDGCLESAIGKYGLSRPDYGVLDRRASVPTSRR